MVDTWTIDVNLKGGATAGVPKGAESMLSGVSGIMGSIGSILKTYLQALGVGALVLIVVQLVAQSKMLVNIVGKIVQMIGLLLSPIADVITAVLYPILLIIKPIAMAVKQIMMPFTKLAMEMFKKMVEDKDASAGMLGVAALINGMTAVVIVLFNEVFKLVGDLIISSIGALIGFFIPPLGDAITKYGTEMFNSAMDGLSLIAISSLAGSLINMGNELGIDTTKFTQDISLAIERVFTNVDEKTIDEVQKSLALLESQDIGYASFLATTTFSVLSSFSTAGDTFIEGVGGMFDNIISFVDTSILRLQELAFGKSETNKNMIFRAGEMYGSALLKAREWGQKTGTNIREVLDNIGITKRWSIE